MTTDVRETEWQFDADDLAAVADWLDRAGAGAVELEDSGSVDQVDVYLDTADRRFQRAGYALRLRRFEQRPGGEVTLKGLDRAAADTPGLRSRAELTERLDQLEPELVVTAPGPVGERVRAVLEGDVLAPLFSVSTHRHTFALTAAGLEAGELALDDTAIEVAGRTEELRLRRVEIEIPECALTSVEPFVDALREACSLRPAALSKYEVGMEAL
jgi:inorganic triphosphatase YgiF